MPENRRTEATDLFFRPLGERIEGLKIGTKGLSLSPPSYKTSKLPFLFPVLTAQQHPADVQSFPHTHTFPFPPFFLLLSVSLAPMRFK